MLRKGKLDQFNRCLEGSKMQKVITTVSIVFFVILLIAALWVFTAIYSGLPNQGLISNALLFC